jgi:sec-independent protein translocase protein TatC
VSQDKNQTLTGHLTELRNRLIYCVIALLLCFAACYYFADQIYNFLLQPLQKAIANGEKRMIYTSLLEGFLTYVKLSFTAAFFFAFPFIAAQFYLFLAPALYKKEKKFTLRLLFYCPFLFFLGASMVYFMVMPMAFEFFLSFENLNPQNGLPIELEAKISEYLSLITWLIFAFGIAFQMPLLIICLVKFGLISVQTLQQKRKYWIVIIFAIAAIITPPDILSQFALALPMMALYEMAILACLKINKKTKND